MSQGAANLSKGELYDIVARHVIPDSNVMDFDTEPAPTTSRSQALPGREFRYLVSQIGCPRQPCERRIGCPGQWVRVSLFAKRRGVPLNSGSEVGDIAKQLAGRDTSMVLSG